MAANSVRLTITAVARVLVLAALGAIAALLVVLASQPPYRARALVHAGGQPAAYDPAAPASVVGADLRSVAFLQAVVRDRQLDIASQPDYLPLIGRVMARLHDGDGPAAPFGGRDDRAFGGERLRLNIFALPNARLGERFALIAGEESHFSLLGPAGNLLAEGQVGRRVHAPAASLLVRVTELNARPRTRFWLSRSDPDSVARELSARLRVRSWDESGRLLQVVLSGDSIGLLETRLDAVVESLVERDRRQRMRNAADAADRLVGLVAANQTAVAAAREALADWRRSHGGHTLEPAATLAVDGLARFLTRTVGADIRNQASLETVLAAEPEADPEGDAERAAYESELAGLDQDQRRHADLRMAWQRLEHRSLALLEVSQTLRRLAVGDGLEGLRLIERTRVAPAGLASVLTPAIAGGLCGALAGILLIRRSSDRREKLATTHRVAVDAGAPVIAVVSADIQLDGPSVASRCANGDLALESFHSLAIAITVLGRTRDCGHVVALTGTGPRSGAQGVATYFARAAAARGQRVLLLDLQTGDEEGQIAHDPNDTGVVALSVLSSTDGGMQQQLARIESDAGLVIVVAGADDDPYIAPTVDAAAARFDFVVLCGVPSDTCPGRIDLLVARTGVDTRSAVRSRCRSDGEAVRAPDGVVLTGQPVDLAAYVAD